MSLTWIEKWTNFLCRAKKTTFNVAENFVTGWLFDPPFQNGKSIVVCHGSWGPGTTNATIEYVKTFAVLGFKVLLIFFEDEFGNPIRIERDIIEAQDAELWLGGDVSIIGTSRGGYVALETFERDLTNFNKCVTFAAPTDMTRFNIFSDYFKDIPDPMTRARNGEYHRPQDMLIIHGIKDHVVPFFHGKDFSGLVGCLLETFNDGHNVFRNPYAVRKCIDFLSLEKVDG